MESNVFLWFVSPERNATAVIASDEYEICWHTNSGRLCTRAATLEDAIRKAHGIDQNVNPEERTRLSYLPTARKDTILSLGAHNGVWGWHGYISVFTKLDAKEIEFSLPELPPDWAYDEFWTNIHVRKQRQVAYLKKCTNDCWRFEFRVVTKAEIEWMKPNHDRIFAPLLHAVADVERAHFLIETD